MEKKFYLPEFDYEVTVGKFAGQADGAVWFKQGGTVILSTVCSAASKEFPGFLPLTVDYRELFSAAGKIPGGYFKREGKFSDKEVLTGRVIDRAIRPLFPLNYFDQIQALSTVYSVDKENVPSVLAVLSTSLALSISKIPFMGPVGAVEIVKINGEWIFNPKYNQIVASDSRILVAGTSQGINMVEGCTNEISEKDFVDVIFKAHEIIKAQVAWQLQIQQEVGVKKHEIVDQFNWDEWNARAESYLTDTLIAPLYEADKVKRGEVMDFIKTEFLIKYQAELTALNLSKTYLEYAFDVALKNRLTQGIFVMGKRIDTRTFDTVRNISTEVGLLPFNHGSALFTRGRTQALVSVTLGDGQDEQRIDDLMGENEDGAFMLHYNFPSFSVGEVRANRGPGRREVGHGYLAVSALRPMLPTKEKFPYTIRIVADMLESDGSTSMATVCGSTMALMNAGVPIKKMVSGVAMGLIKNDQDGKFQILTDISGIEDAFGLMDFKVAGTQDGITAIQMDIKYKGGFSRDVFEMAMAKATAGRMHILGEMRKVMTAPNSKLSDLVPHIVSFKVPTDKIGAIIGSGGKIIRDIIDKTGSSIDIEDDGLVKIFGHPGPKLDQAVAWVKILGGQIEKGTILPGKVKKVAEFGVFVEIAPGQDGLVHVSTMSKKLQTTFASSIKPDDIMNVEIVEYDPATDRIRLRFVGLS